MTTQLRQRVAELTPLAVEANDLRRREAKSRQHTEDAAGMLQDLAVRAQLDVEEAARVQKQQHELLQRDAKACQWIIDLLEEVGKERELKLRAEERSMALEQRSKLDAEVIARLCEERDEPRRTSERLRFERGMIYGERDQAVRECDEA